MTPRSWRQRTPIGVLTLAIGEAGLCRIDLPGPESSIEDAPHDRDEVVAREVDEYFAGRRRRFSTPVDLSGVSPFRRRVLETLHRDVGFGETVTYGELAAMAGRPGAARAVGTAMATNPVPIVVPCHRVVAAGDAIGGYGGGLDMKRALLALEGVAIY